MFKRFSISNESLRNRVDQLSKLSPFYILFVFAPSLSTTIIYWGVRLSSYNIFLAYALANWVTLTILYIVLRRFSLSREVFFLTRPRTRDWILASIAFVIGVFGAYPVAQFLNTALGVPFTTIEFNINSVETFAIVLFYAVITAPFAEEVLFRGLGMGYLISRGISPLLSGGLTLLGFALIHFPPWGFGGVIFILLWGTLPTVLRLWGNSLTPCWLMHVINNIFAYILLPLAFTY